MGTIFVKIKLTVYPEGVFGVYNIKKLIRGKSYEKNFIGNNGYFYGNGTVFLRSKL